jgi:hypothetical protein
MWDALRGAGHELGWHMHLMSYDSSEGCYSFDPEPPWLRDAFAALAGHFDVRATRTGWDYCSDWLMRQLDELGVVVDFSALPGNVAWQFAGRKRIRIDWLRASSAPYHPALHDYQGRGNLQILEVPITGFPNSAVGIARRIIWRLRHGCLAARGLMSTNRMLTQKWGRAPSHHSTVAAFYFHPSGLTDEGIKQFRVNLDILRDLPEAELVTASVLAEGIRV